MTFTKVLTYDRTSASFGRLFMSVKRIPFKYLCRFGKGAWWLRFNDKNEQQNVKSTKTFSGHDLSCIRDELSRNGHP